jgi:hypothetical protein
VIPLVITATCALLGTTNDMCIPFILTNLRLLQLAGYSAMQTSTSFGRSHPALVRSERKEVGSCRWRAAHSGGRSRQRGGVVRGRGGDSHVALGRKKDTLGDEKDSDIDAEMEEQS